MMDSDQDVPGAAAASRRGRRSTRAWRCGSDGTGRRTAGCARRSRRASPCRARASSARSGRGAVRRSDRVIVHTHASENRDEVEVVRRLSGGLTQPRVPGRHRPRDAASLRGALRLGDRCGAGAARRARREGAALPELEPEARIGHRARSPRCGRAASRCRSAPTARRATTASTCSRRCGWRRRSRRSASSPGALTARDALWMATREGRAGARPGARNRVDRSRQARRPHRRRPRRRSHQAPDPDPWSTPRLRRARHRRPADDGRRPGARPRQRPR